MKPGYQWEDFKNPKLIQLRRKFKLDKVIAGEKDEFKQQLLLKDWVHKVLPSGNPSKDYSKKSSIEILKDVAKGRKFWCTQYALVFLQCGLALGWYTRKLGIDTDHKFGEEEMHHGVVDIWSNQFQKWYIIDSTKNIHFEKDNVPLNALEIRKEYLKNKAKNIKGIIGDYERSISFDENSRGFDSPSNYFWFFISLRNNFFEKPGIYNIKALLWIDKYNEDKKWYKGGGKKGKPHLHPMYKSQFIKTNDSRLCFPNILLKKENA